MAAVATSVNDSSPLLPAKSAAEVALPVAPPKSANGSGGYQGANSGGAGDGDGDGDGHANPRPPPAATATVWGSSVTLANTILGVGILAIPQAIAHLGLTVGLIAMAVCGVGAAYGLHLLMEVARRAGVTSHVSWFELAEKLFQRRDVGYIIEVAIAVKCIGVGIVFLIAIGDQLVSASKALFHSDVLSHREVWIGLAAVVIIPLACQATLHALRFALVIGYGSIAFLLFIVLFEYRSRHGTDAADADAGVDDTFHMVSAIANSTSTPTVTMAEFSAKSLTAIATFIFAFTCHQNAFSVYSELQFKSRRNTTTAIACSVGSSFVLYALVGAFGYLTFGQTVSQDILTDYGTKAGGDAHTVLLNVCRIFVAIHVGACYPLQAHPFRKSFCVVFGQRFGWLNDALQPPRGVPWYRNKPHLLVTAIYILITFPVAVCVKELDLVMTLIGATVSNFMTYILPGLFYWYRMKDDQGTATRAASAAMAIIGIATCLTVVTALLYDHYA